MNFVVGLHQFLFQIKEHFGESRLFLGKREHRLIDNLQPERGTNAFALSIGHAKMHFRLATRQ